eukprot:c14959_g1_i3.p1 GENE.c14959_g1_i3~~c14959_g1_i3.p1  ORF type:complete len:871 (-),score=162.13 c14959_g1_i3:617-3202(-)
MGEAEDQGMPKQLLQFDSDDEDDSRTLEEKQADENRRRNREKIKAELLANKKAPERGLRKFQFLVQNILITNTDQKQPHDLFLKFLVGVPHEEKPKPGFQQNQDENDRPPKKIPQLKTEVWKRLKPGLTSSSKRVLSCLWVGEYADLEKQDLVVEAWAWDRWIPNQFVCSVKMKLVDLAQSSVQQTFDCTINYGDDQTEEFCSLQAEVFFNEVFPFELIFTEWRGMELKPADGGILGGGSSSDPYVKFAIPRDYSKFQRGYAWGRTTKTDVQRNTLYPVWGNLKKPLYFTGTRASLETQMLHVTVFDWDLTTKDDIIGQAFIPMSGVLSVGFLQISLALEEPDPDDKKKKIWNDYGTIQGYIRAKTLPLYTQFGQPTVLVEGVTYLAVKIERADKLRAADPNGLSDPFFVLEWDGSQAQTPVQRRTLSPVFNHTVYFAVKAQKITQKILEKKGPVKILCLDWDNSGSNDFLGKCELGLEKITSSFPAPRGAKETKGRLYQSTIPLFLPGIKIESTVTLKAWFDPEIPSEIKLSSTEKAQPRELAKTFYERHKEWKAAFPKRADPTRLAKFSIEALDEENASHYICEYLAPMRVPPEESFPVAPVTPNVLARMVRNITFATDEEALNVEGGEYWTTPNFFMDMKKGDADSHAIMLCNLFLGMQLDAYVCVGKLAGLSASHVWVMTREPNGSVLFWETSRGRPYVLPKRWHGMFQDDIIFNDTTIEPESRNQKHHDENEHKVDTVDKEKPLTVTEKNEIAQRELNSMFLDDDETYIITSNVAETSRPNLAMTQAAEATESEEDGEEEEGEEAKEDEEDEDEAQVPQLPPMPAINLPYSTIELVFNQENVWANIQTPQPQVVCR